MSRAGQVVTREMYTRRRRSLVAALHPEDEAPLAPRRRLWRHDGIVLPSTSLAIVRLLDTLDIRDCEHCEDMRYALIAFVRGLSPVAYVPDVVVSLPADVQERTRQKAQLVAGAMA